MNNSICHDRQPLRDAKLIDSGTDKRQRTCGVYETAEGKLAIYALVPEPWLAQEQAAGRAA